MSASGRGRRVGIVILNWNGWRETLKCLETLEKMTYDNYDVVVVDNGSSDESLPRIERWLAESCLRGGAKVVRAGENLGPSGGYGLGLKYAVDQGCQWVWLLDQDSVVEPTALKELLEAWRGLPHRDRIGILTSVPLNRRTGLPYETSGFWVRGRWKRASRGMYLQKDPFPIDLAGYAGSLIRRDVVEKLGFPRQDFFYAWCDIEYYLRARREGFLIFQVPKSRISLSMGEPRLVDIFGFRPRWRSYYAPWRLYYIARNMTYTSLYRFPGAEGIFWLPFVLARAMIAVYLYRDDRKWQRLTCTCRGIFDGFFARLGKKPPIF